MALSPADLLQTVAEPTRLRILNCLAAAPLFVSDLQVILDLPQPTVSRHLGVLRQQGLVRDTPVAKFVLYRLQRADGNSGKLLAEIIDTIGKEPEYRPERESAKARSRTHTSHRLAAV